VCSVFQGFTDHAAFLHGDYFCLPHLEIFFITGMDLSHGAFLGVMATVCGGGGLPGFLCRFVVVGCSEFAEKKGRED
jgi:hypothetical protein